MNNSNKIRCFISLDLPPKIIQLATSIQNNIKRQNLIAAKYTNPQNIHLTLKFLGETSPQKVEQVKQLLYSIDFESIDDIPLQKIDQIVQEAILLDDIKPYESKRVVK